MKYLLPLALISTLLFSNEEFSFEDDLLQSLDEVSEIATKTKLNIDDSPSFVTVLHSDKLQKLGIDNIFEALSQVPGVQLKRERSGVPVVVFRGVTQKGEVKLMIDGVTINNAYRGSIYYFLDFPIEMVDRIEVIRGAGSVLYGSGAISGVVNIITKSSNREKGDVFVSGGTYDNYKGGAIVSTTVGDAKVAVDAYYQDHKKDVDSTDRHLKDYSVGININDEHFGILARIKKSEIGNAYGIIGALDLDRDKFQNENEAFFTQLSYKNQLAKDTNIEFLAGYSKYEQVVEAAHPVYGALDADYRENAYYGQMDIVSKSIQNNELLIGVKYEVAEAVDSKWRIGTHQMRPVADKDSKRETTSFYLNDKYTIYSDLDIAAGIRYDNYSDFGDFFSPTFSLVYRITEKLRLKALYSQAFRAPSWVELTSNPNLEDETSNSIEFGFVYKQNQSNVLRLNVYRTKLKDMITKNTIYVQNSNGEFSGAEVEYIYTPINELELNLLASYIEATDDDDNDIADVANVLVSTSLLYEHNSGFSFGALFKYISSSKRSDTDLRGDFPSSKIFDGTVSYSFKDILVSLVVKDIFNEGTYYALPPSSVNNDFNDDGRSFLLKAAWEF
jgi:iron complex outermembrane receptor protein